MKKRLTFTEEGYFPNRGNECGIASLANLIYFQYGDLEIAKRIYSNSKINPLVGEDGTTNIIFFPEMLKELSFGKYCGVSQLSENSNDLKFQENLKGRDFKILQGCYKKSLDYGLLNFSDTLSFETPYILFLAKNTHEGHAIVNTGKFFIDNGKISNTLPEGFNISGVFKANLNYLTQNNLLKSFRNFFI